MNAQPPMASQVSDVHGLLSLHATLDVPVQMPPPPGSSRGYPLNINIDPLMYFITVVAMVLLAMLASAWIARKTVNKPVAEALAHT